MLARRSGNSADQFLKESGVAGSACRMTPALQVRRDSDSTLQLNLPSEALASSSGCACACYLHLVAGWIALVRSVVAIISTCAGVSALVVWS